MVEVGSDILQISISTQQIGSFTPFHTYYSPVSKISATFGGQWNEGLRSDTNSWTNIGAFNYEPRRVPKVMYDNVSSMGSCVDPYIDIEQQTCTFNSDCNDGNACTIDVCSGGQCINTMQDNCCGNFVCEAGESTCSDCGPFSLSTQRCRSCYQPKGVMFNVEAKSDIVVAGLKFYAYTATTDVTVYTVAGDYNDFKYSKSSWTQIYSSSFSLSGE